MTLTLEQVRQTRFHLARRNGYEPVDVDNFVDKVEVTLAQLGEENETLKKQVEALTAGDSGAVAPAADGGAEVVWEHELDPEQVRYLAHAFHRIAVGLAAEAERRGFPIAPPEGDEFYQCLVLALLDALERDSEPMREFAVELRTTWPGLKAD